MWCEDEGHGSLSGIGDREGLAAALLNQKAVDLEPKGKWEDFSFVFKDRGYALIVHRQHTKGLTQKEVVKMIIKLWLICFCKWRDDGTLLRIVQSLNEDADMENLSLDSTVIKAHPHSMGANKGL